MLKNGEEAEAPKSWSSQRSLEGEYRAAGAERAHAYSLVAFLSKRETAMMMHGVWHLYLKNLQGIAGQGCVDEPMSQSVVSRFVS